MGLGDDLMITGEVKGLVKKNPNIKVAVKLDKKRQRWSEAFYNNPHMASPEYVNSGKPIHWLGPRAGRRYMSGETPDKRIWTDVGPVAGEFFFTDQELDYADKEHKNIGDGAVFIEPNLKPQATTNKDWGWHNWLELVKALPNVNWVQLAKSDYKKLPGVKVVSPPSYRCAAALIRHSALCVLPEGGLHHAAAAVNKKAVVIFGGYISPVQTGYHNHVNLFTGGTPCGMKVPCQHCKTAMAAIKPTIVADWVLSLI